MQTSIRNIAKQIGISRTTVWRALNSLPRVNEGTREKVLKLAREMNYNHGETTRRFILNRVCNIELVVFNYERLTRPLFVEAIRGIQDILREVNYNMQVSTVSEEDFDGPWGRKVHISRLKEKLVRGLLVFGTDLDSEDLKSLKQIEIPFVLLNCVPWGIEGANYVYPDYDKGIRVAIRHLVQLGHERIAFISGPMEFKLDDEKLKGYRRALEEHGLEYEKRLVKKGDYKREKAIRATTELLKLDERPTAIIAGDDIMACGAIEAVRREGLMVPEDIAVMGFNDEKFSSLINPPLTTVSIHEYEMGRMAAEMLINLIKRHKVDKGQIVLEPKLIVRSSCGPLINSLREKK